MRPPRWLIATGCVIGLVGAGTVWGFAQTTAEQDITCHIDASNVLSCPLPAPTTDTATTTTTETQTATVTETAPGPTSTVTETAPGPTTTVTQTVPGPTTTIPGPTTTVPGPTTTVPGPTTTVTTTVTATPTPTPTTTPPGACPVAGANVPGGSDGAGGCFPGVDNTGPNAAANTMPTYTGSCTITAVNVTIDSKVVNCRTIVIASTGGGFTLRNSYLNGGIIQSGSTAAAFTVQDSLVDSAVQYPACGNGSCPAGLYACGDPNNQTTDCGVTGANFTILRTEIIHSNRAAYCFTSCLVQDNYFHGTNLWPDVTNRAHASSMREEQSLTLRHNSLHCSYTGPFVNSDIGCSADLTGYPDFVAIKNNTVDRNLFVANTGNAFCAYGGGTAGKPHSNDATNATNQKFTGNVFQRGSNSKCGAFGPVTDFITTRSGNVWSGNVWDNGGTVPAA
jgi:hypothetical protein